MMRFSWIHFLCFVLLDNVRQINPCPVNCQYCESDDYCVSCIDVYAGRNCDYYCSNCHPKTRCDKLTYFCTERCRDGLSGNLCNEDCHRRCLSCNRTDPNVCLTCETDRYGAECVSCPVSCTNQKCDQQGVCTLGCKPGYWGQMCEKVCSEHCIDNSCFRENGTCTDECEDGSTGSECNEPNNEAILSPGVVAIIVVLPVITLTVVIIVYRLRRRIFGFRRFKERPNVDGSTHAGEDVPLNQIATENVTTGQARSSESNVDESIPHFTNEEIKIEVAIESQEFSNEEPHSNENVDTTETKIQQFQNYVCDKSTDNYKKDMQKLDDSNIGKNLQERTTDTIWKFVQGDRKGKSYATCKGGTDWAAVWKQVLFDRSDIIVLFTPQNYYNMLPMKKESLAYGDVVVSCSDEVRNDTCLIARKLTLQEQVEERPKEKYVVTFLHYLVVQGNSTPDEQNFSRLQKIVRDIKSKKTGPYFVLCSNECDGYAGTFIALDMLVDKAEYTGSVDVYSCVKKLRDDMVSVAKTIGQYELLHKALAIALAQNEMKTLGLIGCKEKSDTVAGSTEKSSSTANNLS